MKRFGFIIFFIFIISVISFSADNNTQLNQKYIKRTILILPILNKEKNKDYDYISNLLYDVLLAELKQSEMFNINTEKEQVENIIKKLNMQNKNYINEENAKSISYELKTDVVIISQFIIDSDTNNILLTIKALDIFTDEIVVRTNIKGELGVGVFKIIDESIKEISTQMKQELPKIEKTYFEEMMNIIKQEQILLRQKNFTSLNKIGVGLISTGGTMLLIGIPILIYDMAGYYSVVNQNYLSGPRTKDGYTQYDESYSIFIGLFSASIVTIGVGIVFLSISIPFLIYKKKDKKVNLFFNYNKLIEIGFVKKF